MLADDLVTYEVTTLPNPDVVTVDSNNGNLNVIDNFLVLQSLYR